MEFAEVVRHRHSVREFQPDPLPRDLLERLVQAAALAPSAANEQPWRFYVTQGPVRDRVVELLGQSTSYLGEYLNALGPEKKERAIRWFTSLGDAPVVMVVAMRRADDDFMRLNRLIGVGAALENLLLAATDEGVASCNVTFSFWIRDELARELDLPQEYEIVSLVALGWPTDEEPIAPKHDMDVATFLG